MLKPDQPPLNKETNMSLTIPQKKYLVKRIDEVATAKVNKLTNVAGMSNKQIAIQGLKEGYIGYPMDIEKIHEAIDLVLGDGEDVRWGSETLGTIGIEPMLDGFNKYKNEMQSDLAKKNNDIVKRRNAIYEEATKIKDKAMFGTEQEAYALLDQFMEMEV